MNSKLHNRPNHFLSNFCSFHSLLIKHIFDLLSRTENQRRQLPSEEEQLVEEELDLKYGVRNT